MKNTGSLIDILRSGHDLNFRHHNPYIQEGLLYSDILHTKKELLDNPSILNSFIQKDTILEIGCYLGKTVIELATQNPNKNVLGIDITYKRAVKSARKIKKQNLTNAKVSICDGLFLCQKILPSDSLSGVCVFFPDPWPKERECKNRLLNEEFVSTIYNVLKQNGFFWLKTDQKNYFLNAECFLKEKGFILSTQSIPEVLNASNYETEFQKLFVKKSIPFYQGIFIKP